MQLTKGAIGNLINRYKAVLKKCHLLNAFGSLAVAGMLVMGSAGIAGAADYSLSSDYNTQIEIAEGENSNIQLNGYNINTGADKAIIVNGKLEINDSASSGKISSNDMCIDIMSSLGNTAEVIINSGTIEATGSGTPTAIFLWPDGGTAKVTINDGTIRSSVYAITGNGAGQDGTEININGGLIESTGGTAIYHPQAGIINISDGTIIGPCAIEMRSGDVNISGGTITGNNDEFLTRNSGNGNTVYGAALAISQHTTQKDINVNITGGTFNGIYAIYEADHTGGKNTGAGYKDNVNISITNGTFNGKIYSQHCENFITGGTFSDPTALHYLGDGANIKLSLTEDYSGETGTLNNKAFNIGSNRTVAMDLGGHTFSMTKSGNTSAGNISVANGTLKLAQDLALTGGTLDMSSSSTLAIDGGSLTIDGGTFVADASLLLTEGLETNTTNGIRDTNIVGTKGNLNLRWFDDDYTADEYATAKKNLLGQGTEGATLNFLNASLALNDTQDLVVGAAQNDNEVTITMAPVVVEATEKPSDAATSSENVIDSVPDKIVSVVHKDDNTEDKELLAADTITIADSSKFTAKGLEIAGTEGAATVTLKVTDNSDITLTGGEGCSTGVVAEGEAVATAVTVDSATLNMGLAGNTQDQGLTLAKATVTNGGTLNANGGGEGTSQYAIDALTMEANSQVNVLDSIMQIGEFTAGGGTMFVDPAYVNIGNVASTFGTELLVGAGSTVNIGGMSEADMRQAMETAGISVGPNFTVGANQSVLVLGQNLTLGSTGKIVVDANVNEAGEISGGSVSQGAYFGTDSLLVVNGNTINGTAAAITLDASNQNLYVQSGAKLVIANAVNGQTYTIVGNVNTGGSTLDGWKGVSSTTDMVSLGDAAFTDATGSPTTVTVSATRNDAATVFPKLSDGMADAVNTLYGQQLNNVDSPDMGVRFLSRATDNRYLGADKDAAASTIESAARMAFAGAVPQMTKMASDAATNAVVNRLGFANPADGIQAMDAEGKIVDRNTTGFALWIAPLWQNMHGWSMEAGNMDYGFNGNLGGVSLGADYTFENAIRAGITFNIGGGYAESSGGDLSSTQNNMNFWGLGAYVGWNYQNFGLMADVAYTSTWNDLSQDMDGRMGMGDLEADVQASALSAGVRAEYKLETSVLDVIPHIGVRYMSLNTWGYDVESSGGTLLEADGFHQDIWTFPVGITFSKDLQMGNGWAFTPSVDFSVIPAAGDIEAKHDVAFTGLPGSYEVETQMMDYLTWQGGIGLELGNENMSIGVNYTLQAGQNSTGHGLFGSFRYEF